MPPSSHGRSGFTTIRPAGHLSHDRRRSSSDGVFTQPQVIGAAATGSACRRFPSSQTLPRQGDTIPPVITAAGSRPVGCRPALHPPAAPIAHRPELCSTHQSLPRNPFIVIRKRRSTSRRRRRHYRTISSRAALWGISRHTDRLDRPGMGRNTCANQRPHLPLRSSAF